MFRSLLPCLLAMICLLSPLSAAADSLLIIHSGSKESEGAKSFATGVETVLPRTLKTQFWLNAGTDDSEEYMETMATRMESKLDLNSFRGIICNGDDAFALFRKYGQELFPDVPAVFSGVLDYQEFMRGPGNTPGIRADYGGGETFERMLELHPTARTIALIVDDTPAGLRIREQVEKAFQKHMDRVQLIIPGQEAGRDQGMDAQMLLKTAEFMPDNSLILFGTFTRDKNGNHVDEAELARELVARSSAPVYVLSAEHFGAGAMGGVMPGPEDHGREAATLLNKLWNGAKAEDLAIRILENHETFDVALLEEHGADTSVLGGKKTAEEQGFPSSAIYGTGGLLALLAIILIALRRKSRKN